MVEHLDQEELEKLSAAAVAVTVHSLRNYGHELHVTVVLRFPGSEDGSAASSDPEPEKSALVLANVVQGWTDKEGPHHG